MLDIKQKYCVFDFETEGLNLKYSRPWELSYIQAQGNRILEEEQIYIDIPNLDLPPFIKKLTNFNQQKYDSTKVPAATAFKKFLTLTKDEDVIFVGQNVLKFDVYMWQILGDMAGEYPVDFSFLDRIFDTVALGRAYKEGLEKPQTGSILDWQMKILNDRSLKSRVSQTALLKLFGIEYDKDKLHDGLYDCQKSWEIFQQLKKVLAL